MTLITNEVAPYLIELLKQQSFKDALFLILIEILAKLASLA